MGLYLEPLSRAGSCNHIYIHLLDIIFNLNSGLIILKFITYASVKRKYYRHKSSRCAITNPSCLKPKYHSEVYCFIRWHLTSRPRWMKKTGDMTSEHHDSHGRWLSNRGTNDIYLIITYLRRFYYRGKNDCWIVLLTFKLLRFHW